MEDQINQEVATQLKKEHEQGKTDRSVWTDHWDEVAFFGVPRKDNAYGQRVKGEKNPGNLFTGHMVWAVDFVASAFHGMLTNPSSVWFGLTSGDRTVDEKDAVRFWIEGAVTKMIDTLNGSNFQTEIIETYTDLASLGTNVLRMEEDEEDIINFNSSPVYNATISEDKKGDVVTTTREYKYDLLQIDDTFGALPERIKMELGKDTTKKFTIIHIVKPIRHAVYKNQLRHLDINPPASMEYVSFHILESSSYILSTDFFHENPYAVSRWSKTSDEKYGRSPLMKALADAKLMNAMKKVTIQGAQLAIAPPVETADNSYLRPLRLKPFGVNYRRASSKIGTTPIYNGARPDIGQDMINDLKNDVNLHFFIDQLRMVTSDRMTATEVIQRRDEQLRSLGPLLGRLHRELLKPIIDRLFGIMLRRGLFLPMPDELSKIGNLKIKYVSTIAKAQIVSEAENVNKAIQASMGILETQPQALDLINGDEVLRDNLITYGAAARTIRTEKEVKEIREARQEAMQQQQQQEDNMQDAEMAGKLPQ